MENFCYQKNMSQHYVYLTASKRNGTLYTGKCDNLVKRTYEHKEHAVRGFTDRYDVTILVHYEVFDSHEAALQREKTLKKWKRQWKLELIEKNNPDWKDLYDEITK